MNFEASFSLWARSDKEGRTTNLTGIIRHAADLGALLAVQPCLFRFRWSKSGAGGSSQQTDAGAAGRSFELAPALFKMTDTSGSRLTQPQLMVEAVGR